MCGSQDISTRHYLLDCNVINMTNTPSLIEVRKDIEEEFEIDGVLKNAAELENEILKRTDKLVKDVVFICKCLEEARNK